jgi:hypothetical protein
MEGTDRSAVVAMLEVVAEQLAVLARARSDADDVAAAIRELVASQEEVLAAHRELLALLREQVVVAASASATTGSANVNGPAIISGSNQHARGPGGQGQVGSRPGVVPPGPPRWSASANKGRDAGRGSRPPTEGPTEREADDPLDGPLPVTRLGSRWPWSET